MSIIRKTLAELQAEPFRFSADERARLDAMTDEEVERIAESDPDNPPLTNEQLASAVFARAARLSSRRGS